MTLTENGFNRGRYIIQAMETKQLTDFIEEIDQDPDMRLLDTIGPVDRPHTVVVEMSHDKARALEERFRTSNTLKIEPDRPLSLFSQAT